MSEFRELIVKNMSYELTETRANMLLSHGILVGGWDSDYIYQLNPDMSESLLVIVLCLLDLQGEEPVL